MDRDEAYQRYRGLMEMLAMACRTINTMPLAEMAEANQYMQTVGPIFEPTIYVRGGGDRLRDQRRVIDAAINLQLVFVQIAGRVLEEALEPVVDTEVAGALDAVAAELTKQEATEGQ